MLRARHDEQLRLGNREAASRPHHQNHGEKCHRNAVSNDFCVQRGNGFGVFCAREAPFMKSVLLCVVAVASLSACGSPLRAHYRTFGLARPTADAKVVTQYEAAAEQRANQRETYGDKGMPTPPASIMVLIDTLPEGIEAGASGIRVTPGYPCEILGRGVLKRDRQGAYGPITSEMLINEFKFLAQEVGATLVLMSVDEGQSQDEVEGGVAILIRADTSKIDLKKSVQKKLPFNET